MARDAKISLQSDQTLAEMNEVEISDSNARGRDRGVAPGYLNNSWSRRTRIGAGYIAISAK